MPPPLAVLPGPAVNVPLPVIAIVLPSGAIAVSDGVVAPTTHVYVSWFPVASLAAASPLTPSNRPQRELNRGHASPELRHKTPRARATVRTRSSASFSTEGVALPFSVPKIALSPIRLSALRQGPDWRARSRAS